MVSFNNSFFEFVNSHLVHSVRRLYRPWNGQTYKHRSGTLHVARSAPTSGMTKVVLMGQADTHSSLAKVVFQGHEFHYFIFQDGSTLHRLLVFRLLDSEVRKALRHCIAPFQGLWSIHGNLPGPFIRCQIESDSDIPLFPMPTTYDKGRHGQTKSGRSS